MPQSTIFPAPQEPPRSAHTDETAAAFSVDQMRQADVESNLATLLALPFEQCPWPAVRNRLLRLAIEGAEIYAYRPAHQPEFVIWDCQPEPWMESRFSPRDWAVKYGYLTTTPKEGTPDANDD